MSQSMPEHKQTSWKIRNMFRLIIIIICIQFASLAARVLRTQTYYDAIHFDYLEISVMNLCVSFCEFGAMCSHHVVHRCTTDSNEMTTRLFLRYMSSSRNLNNCRRCRVHRTPYTNNTHTHK